MKAQRIFIGPLGAALVLCAIGGAAAAQPVDPSGATSALSQGADAAGALRRSARAQADMELLDKAATAMDRRLRAGLTPFLADLNAALDQSLKADPEDPTLYVAISLVLGGYYIDTQQHQRALTVVDKGLRHDPLDPTLASQKATALVNLKRPDEALAALDAAVAGDEGSRVAQARVQRLRGVILIQLNRLNEAEAALKRAQWLQPRHPGAAIGLKQVAQLRRSTGLNRVFKPLTRDEAGRKVR